MADGDDGYIGRWMRWDYSLLGDEHSYRARLHPARRFCAMGLSGSVRTPYGDDRVKRNADPTNQR